MICFVCTLALSTTIAAYLFYSEHCRVPYSYYTMSSKQAGIIKQPQDRIKS